MLLFDKPDLIDGYTVYPDHASISTFYIMPKQPTFRLDDKGKPVFKFIKYRFPVDRPDGKKGGGFVIFDVEFTVPEADQDKIRTELQGRLDERFKNSGHKPQAIIGQPNYLRGTAGIQFLDSGGALVQKIQNPGAPSLYGKMITPFTVELTPEGATLAEQALQGSGGVVQVYYDVWTPVRLPPCVVNVSFDAKKFMEFSQSVDIDWDFWGDDSYRETIREKFGASESQRIDIDPGGITDQKVLNNVRDWAQRSLEEATKRLVLGDIAPVPEDQRKVPDGIEHLRRNISVEKVASYRATYREGYVMEWNPQPRGTLVNITGMSDKDGNALKWSDYAITVDLDDPFFKTLNVSVRANAEFETLPLDSIEVKINYEVGNEKSIAEYSLRSAADIGKFASFIANNVRKYKYSYQVNYKGESRRYDSPVLESDEGFLTINVGDTGILDVQVLPGDLNFTQVKQAQVTLRYDDAANDVPPIEHVFILDKDHQDHRLTKVIFTPRSEPYKYAVKYFMENGKEFATGEKEGRSPQLFINDPFSAMRNIGIRGFGDFNNRIDTIFIDLKYVDAANDYTQTKSVALSASNPFVDWAIPVIDEAGGMIQYTPIIRLKNGSIEELGTFETDKNTILVGDAPREIQVLPDLLDFTTVKLAKVSLAYVDEANSINQTGDLVFRAGSTAAAKWAYSMKDKTKKDFTWKATFFMADGSSKTAGPTTTSEETIVLQVPA